MDDKDEKPYIDPHLLDLLRPDPVYEAMTP